MSSESLLIACILMATYAKCSYWLIALLKVMVTLGHDNNLLLKFAYLDIHPAFLCTSLAK